MMNILITGASSGIGAALAQDYAAPGRFLALTGRNPERLAQVAEICRAQGAEVEAKQIDASSAEMAAWVEDLDKRRPLALVLANAGISGGTGEAAGESAAQTRRIFAVNLDGVLNTILPIIPAMQARKSGQIALVSSLAAFRGWPSAPAYCASKAAIKVWGESLRGALAADGIKVSVICPGFVESRITDANNFAMPMLMSADKAARIIRKGLARNKGRIAFPWPMHLAAWLAAALPPGLTDRLGARLPKKG